MKDLYDFDLLFTLFEQLNKEIPEGNYENIEIGNTKFNINKKDNLITIDFTKNNAFDDSDTKHFVQLYKELIQELDDCLFVEATEEMEQTFDIKRFDVLLNQKSFTEEEASEVNEMIRQSLQIICNYLKTRINKLIDTYNKFNNLCR